MPISSQLQRKLKEVLGADAADDLVRGMEAMDTYRGDIGELRHVIAELRHDMQLGFARSDTKLEKLESTFDARFGTLESRFDAAIERGLREQTRFFFLAWSVLLASIVGLYAR